jgi:hypothetical protein
MLFLIAVALCLVKPHEGTIVAKDHPNAQIYVDGQGNGKVTGLFPEIKH